MDEMKNLKHALSKFDEIDRSECRSVMSDYDSFVSKIQHMIYVQSFIEQYILVEKWYLKGNSAFEKRSLMHAYSILNLNKITDEDLSGENLQDYKTGTLLTSEKITNRLRELQRDGWK